MNNTYSINSDYSYSRNSNNEIIKNIKREDIVLDLRLKNPFEELTAIPVDNKAVNQKYEKFIDIVRDQQFVVFMNESKNYFNNEKLEANDIKNPIIKSKVEEELKLKIMLEKSGIINIFNIENENNETIELNV